MGPFGFVKNNIYLRHGFDLIKSQWKVVKVLSKMSKSVKEGEKMGKRNYVTGRRCNWFVCYAMRHNLCSALGSTLSCLQKETNCIERESFKGSMVA